MKCRRCGEKSEYPICRGCAGDKETKKLNRLDEIGRFIQDGHDEIRRVKKMKSTKSNRLILGIVLTSISLIFIWIGLIWYSIIGFFILVFGLGFLVVGMLDVYPDKLAKLDFYDDQNKQIRELTQEKRLIVQSLKEST